MTNQIRVTNNRTTIAESAGTASIYSLNMLYQIIQNKK
jgi:hypothetical protein